MVRRSPSESWTRNSWSTSDCRHGRCRPRSTPVVPENFIRGIRPEGRIGASSGTMFAILQLLGTFVANLFRSPRRLEVENPARHPTAEWLAQQIVEAFPWNTAPTYLVRDNDGVYGQTFTRRVRTTGIRDRPISPRSPWQTPYVERLIYVIDADGSGSRFRCLAGVEWRLRARSTRCLAGSVWRAERLNSQGPSCSGYNASIAPFSAARPPATQRRVLLYGASLTTVPETSILRRKVASP